MAETQTNDMTELWDATFEHDETDALYGEGFKYGEQLLENLTDREILDLGAGDGRLAVELAANGNRVTALDLSRVAIEKVKAKAEAHGNLEGELDLYVADLEKLDEISEAIGDKTFDVITLVNVIQFLPRTSVDDLFKLISERLEPNGEVLIRGPHPKPPFYDGDEYVDNGAFTHEELAMALDRAGLSLMNYKDIEWPPKKGKGPQPAYWAFVTHNPVTAANRDDQVRFDREF